MELTQKDIIKYKELTKHHSDISPNIGIIGNSKRFKKLVNAVLKRIYFDTLIINKDETKYTIIVNDIEVSYIQIQNLSDLNNLYFREYL